jgi:hypothetical protein
LLLVAVLAVVEDFTDRRIGVGGNLDEVELVVTCPFQGLVDGYDIVVAFWLYDANLVGSNFLIYAKFIDVSDGWVGGC